MTNFSKKFFSKSPFKSGGLALGRVLMGPRGINPLGKHAVGSSEFSGVKPTYSYTLKDAMRDVKAGVDKKEVMKRYEESMRKGPQYII
jgi:hypothetical protein